MKKKLAFILILISIILNIYSISLRFNLEEKTDTIILTEVNHENECLNKTIVNASYCLKDKLEKFYKYNISNSGKELSEQKLKIEGGVCLHYSEWYKKQFILLGANKTTEPMYEMDEKHKFYVTTKQMRTDKILSHIVTVVSNDEAYCVLDQLNIGCVYFDKK